LSLSKILNPISTKAIPNNAGKISNAEMRKKFTEKPD